MTDRDLLCRLHACGLHYAGDNNADLEQLVVSAEAERHDMPLCFARSYSSRSSDCRTCDIRRRCEEGSPRWQMPLVIVPVVECGEPGCDGDLIVDLCDGAGNVVDRGCSTPGCPGTVSRRG